MISQDCVRSHKDALLFLSDLLLDLDGFRGVCYNNLCYLLTFHAIRNILRIKGHNP